MKFEFENVSLLLFDATSPGSYVSAFRRIVVLSSTICLISKDEDTTVLRNAEKHPNNTL
jgi:hypothetical protein